MVLSLNVKVLPKASMPSWLGLGDGDAVGVDEAGVADVGPAVALAVAGVSAPPPHPASTVTRAKAAA
ncbi:hypothetical protein ACFOW4_13540 [Micromonospora sp. GCM10011542]|uniref:hypothetical protein n=1 Tax=Micromonospora sp. GCM10011542 TaxID=3317337 RepID=UPI00360E703C